MPTLVRSILAALALGAAFPAGGAASVELAGNPAGEQVIFHRVLDQPTRPLYVAARPAGSAFDPLVPISAIGGLWDAQGFVDDSGSAVAALTTLPYLDLNLSSFRAQVAVRPAGGGFGNPVDFYPPGGPGSPSTYPHLELDAGASGDAIVTDGLSYRFRPAGGDFGPLTRLPGDGLVYSGAAVDADGSTTAFGGREGRWYQTVRPPGGEFGTPTEVTTLNGFGGRLVTARNGRALMVGIGETSMSMAERPPNGQFGAPAKIADVPPDSELRGVALAPSGAAAVAFGTYGRATTTVLVRDAGGPFHAPRRISTAALSVAVDDAGDAVAAWQRRNHQIVAAYRPRGGSFGDTLELAPPRPFAPGGVDAPGLAIDDAGNASVGWEESDGESVSTLVRSLNGPTFSAAEITDTIASFTREGPDSACRPANAKVLASGKRATVFASNEVYGCLLGRGAPVLLALPEEFVHTKAFAFKGPLVAYVSEYRAHSTDYLTLHVLDLRDPFSGENRSVMASKYDATGFVPAIQLKRDGAVAFVDCPGVSITDSDAACARVGGMRKRVRIWDAHASSPRNVDGGRTINPRTLKLVGSFLTWRHGKRLRHATLR